MFSIADNLENVRQRIKKSAKRAGRNADAVSLLAVSKTRGAKVLANAMSAGLSCFGENYLSEALSKQEELKISGVTKSPHQLKWHFIGPVQSNKTRQIAQHFDWVQSLDRVKVADRLNSQRPAEMAPLNVCIQVNVSEERSKSGLKLENIEGLAAHVDKLPRLKLRGLMAIPMATQDTEKLRLSFLAMHEAFGRLQKAYPDIDTLSMGMSSDLEIAVECGSTLVRVGSDLFGQRK